MSGRETPLPIVKWQVIFLTRKRGTRHAFSEKVLGEVEGAYWSDAQKAAYKKWREHFKPSKSYPRGRITLRPEKPHG